MHQKTPTSRISTDTEKQMSQQYYSIFHHMAEPEPSAELSACILTRIHGAKIRQARIRFYTTAGVTGFSCIALIPASNYVLNALDQSGFYEYSSLLFSDSALLFTYWKEFAFTIAESLPLGAITLVLGTALIFIASARMAAKNARPAFSEAVKTKIA
jgi:hypothetical protein